MINESLHVKLAEDLLSRIKEAQDRLEEAFKPMQERFKILAEKLPISLKKLANHGWYISGDSSISEGLSLSEELDIGNHEKVDKILEQFYEKESSSIINRLNINTLKDLRCLTKLLKLMKKKCILLPSIYFFPSLMAYVMAAFLKQKIIRQI